MTPIVFRVLGIPQTQAGTKTVPTRTKNGDRVFRKISEGGKDLSTWRQDVSAAAAKANDLGLTLAGPVELRVIFRFPMPASRPVWAKRAGYTLHAVKPDCDKLVRAIGDSLKVAAVIRDDGQIAVTHAMKIEVWDAWTGVAIRVRQLDPRARLDVIE